ncbi:inositol-1-monophosphatase [Psychrosphaera haliotis]|uniref:Inositol-1-monophosphatase n=1 Tax=Psychrosphaera haliotis TaxID=555083 RepID=A0A6N8F828_9GAMM|nr:inositol-1-monophosphatase [Psychrosphaera haliotis]MUH72408.1 inositol-1-monophosphatase [Psychrosphaera haliotis]
MQPMLNIAVRAARNAGKVIARAYEQLDMVKSELKGANDFVTNVDIEAEQAIISTIQASYPDHSFVAEESGVIDGNAKYQWIIDPLDGTTNFVKGIPHFAVSIALRVDGKLEQAVVFDPIRGELFTASKGAGAQLDGRRIRVSKAKDLSGTILATGFPFKQKHQIEAYSKIFNELFLQVADMRRAGSAALDICYVAAGRVEGFFEIGLRPWDTAAGQLIAQEAGAVVADFEGGNNYDKSGNIVVATPKVLGAILKAIRPHLNDGLRTLR